MVLLLAQPVATSVVSNNEPALGAPVTLRIEVDAPPEQVELEGVSNAKNVEVISMDAAKAPAEHTHFKLVVQPLATGEVELPTARFTIQSANGAPQVVETDPVKVTVADPLAGVTSPQLEPERPVRFIFSEIWLFVIAIAIGVIAGILYVVFRRKKPTVTEAARPPLTAWDRALQRLEELEPPAAEDAEAARNRVDDVCDVLREYVEARFALRAQEQTSEEFLNDVRSLGALRQYDSLLTEFFGRCDEVKFAGQTPSRDDVLEVIAAARSFVVETRLVATPAPEATEAAA